MTLSGKQIKKTKVVDEPVEKIWRRWSTHEGLKSFLGLDNAIELKIGGKFEIYFLLNNPAGLRGSEGCKVLSYLPEKMISFSWNVPPRFEDLRKSEYKTWVVVFFNKLIDNKTEIVLTHLGWPADEEWIPVFEYFTEAWDRVLNGIK